MRQFAAAELALPDLQAWDMAFASERLKESRYAFSEQEVRQYFTEPKVLEGLFRIVETLFDVAIREDSAAVWHPSVRFFRVERPRADPGHGSDLVGQFYLDLHARPGKRPGAWMDDVCGRWARPEGGLQTPVAHLVCNFAAPISVDGTPRPALLTHDDVTTLFHEFGHGLQHMLTQVNDIAVSGIAGVEWDAVELPSQFMENFCWEWEVLRRLTAHVDSGEEMPRGLFDRMLAAKNFQSGLQMVRQAEFARSRRRAGAGLQPLPAHLLARLRGRLFGGLLQLQVGGGAQRRRLERVRGERDLRRRHRSPLPRGLPGDGRQPSCTGKLHCLSRS